MLSQPELPTDGVQRLLFEAAWRNERIANKVRGALCAFIIITAIPNHIIRYGHPIPSSFTLLGWGIFIVVMEYFLRRTYHRGLSWVISTVDIVFCSLGQVALYRDLLAAGEPDEARIVLGGIMAWVGVLTAVNALRFSWPLALWTAAFGSALSLALVTTETGFRQGWVWSAIPNFMIFALVAMVARGFKRGLIQLREREVYARFLPGPLLERVARDPTVLNLGGEEQHATMLFSDIRGFTAMSSQLQPIAVVHLLNEYFDEMVAEIFARGGILDKFIGDGICAAFGPPLAPEEQARRALECALGMRARLQKLNALRRSRGEPELAIGIDIHSGMLVAGNIGSSARMEYTHIGDAVNTCSRIESLTKELGAPVLASESTVRLLGESHPFKLRAMPAAPVKGKEAPLTVYAVDGVSEGSAQTGERVATSA